MHVYIYDDYLSAGKYNKAINNLEIRLTDLGLNGKIIRLGNIKNIKSAIQSEIRMGARTIIAVGNNQTVNKIIGAIIEIEPENVDAKKILLGIVPIGEGNSIAASFGIKNQSEACNILLARRVEKIDLGLAGEYYFLNQATIQSAGTIISLNGFSLEIMEKGEAAIINLANGRHEKLRSNPHDGCLDIYIQTGRKDRTYLSAKKLTIENQREELLIDEAVQIKTPVEVGVIKDRLQIIVGKDRVFE